MEAVAHICDPHLTDKFQIGGNLTDDRIMKMLKAIAPTFNETMMLCKLQNRLKYCGDYFEETITDEGRCFTFNMLNAEELFRDGYVSPHNNFEIFDLIQSFHTVSVKNFSNVIVIENPHGV